jgi:hypothetical protein
MPLPEADETFLNSKGHSWELQAGRKEQLLIIHDYALPEGRYNPSLVDILIKIPSGYPNANPDMFFIAQKVARADGTPPQNVTETPINGGTWHQWSRHYPANLWRAGIDGLESYMLAVRKELEKGL